MKLKEKLKKMQFVIIKKKIVTFNPEIEHNISCGFVADMDNQKITRRR